MTQFTGVFSSSTAGYHTFISEDEMLVGMGLGNFTKNSCRDLYTKILPSLKIAYPSAVGKSFLFTYLEWGCYIYYQRFNSSTRKFEENHTTLSLNEVYSLIDYHDQKQSRKNSPTDSAKDYTIHAIKNSLANAVVIEIPRSNILPGIAGFAKLKLTFQDSGKRSADRKMVMAGGQMMAGVPTTAGGTRYSARSSRDFQQNSPNNVGSFIPESEGGENNPANTVAAPISYTYNTADKTWESGTKQSLAKLITDVDPANINRSAGPSNVVSNSEYYDPESPNYAGSFTTGRAMLMSTQNGNPHVFGPNIIECNGKNTEIVTCVNRSPKRFFEGEQVMLSYIGGEWIITPLGEGDYNTTVTLSPWAFSKFVSNSDAYFRNMAKMDQIIRPETYIQAMRQRFYHSKGDYTSAIQDAYNKLGSMTNPAGTISQFNFDRVETWKPNGDSDPLNNGNYQEEIEFETPQKGYYFTTIYDQVNAVHGGLLSNNITLSSLGGPSQYILPETINILDEAVASDLTYAQADLFFPFWGPVHSEGVTEVSKFSDSDFYTQYDSEYFNREGASLRDITRLNVPSEMISRFLEPTDITGSEKTFGLNSSDYPDPDEKAQAINNGLSPDRNNLINTQIYAPFYETKSNHNHIQYSPLTDTILGSVDRLSTVATSQYRQFRLQAQQRCTMSLEDIWSTNFFTRNGLLNEGGGTFSLNDACGAYPASIVAYPPSPLIPYDCFIEEEPIVPPKGAPRWFRDNGKYIGANAVGVVAGWSSFGKSGGGDVTFTVNQRLGIHTENTVSGSNGTGMGIIPTLPPIVIPGTGPTTSQNTVVQWGGVTDDPVYSFGTSALHVMIYDYWPENDTFFDPRYFAVIHFNPRGAKTLGGSLNLTIPGNGLDLSKVEKFGTKCKFEVKGMDGPTFKASYARKDAPRIEYDLIPRIVDKQETNVDIRVPTFGDGPDKSSYNFDNPDSVNKYYRDLKQHVGFLVGAVDAVLAATTPPPPPPTTTGDPNSDTTTAAPEESKPSNPNDEVYPIPRASILRTGSTINRYTYLRPENEWNISTLRRGQFLSEGGFTYLKKVIGLNWKDERILSRGSGFKVGEEIELEKGVVVRVLSVDPENNDGILSFSLATTRHGIPYYNGRLVNDKPFPLAANGEGFMPDDFTTQSEVNPDLFCYKLSVPPSRATGSPAVIEFYSGLVWEKAERDEGPQKHGATVNVALPSSGGEKGRATGSKTTTINLAKNSSGRYNIFTYFHNDITQTPGTPERIFIGGFLQYIDLNIQ